MNTELINKNQTDTLPEIFTTSQIETLTISFKNCRYYDSWTVKRNYIMFLINYHLALRPKEAVCIKLSEVDLDKKVIYISPMSNKLRKGRPVPIPISIFQEVVEYMNTPRPLFLSPSEYLFPCRQGEHISRDHWTDIFKSKLRQTGIWKNPRRGAHGHYSLYTLRHTKATEVYLIEGDIMLVANMLGHTTLESTKVYIHLAMVRTGYLDRMRNAMSVQFRIAPSELLQPTQPSFKYAPSTQNYGMVPC